jgi:hypothetical protein
LSAGKALIVDMDRDLHLLVHLKMTGQLVVVCRGVTVLAGGHPSPSLLGPMPNPTTLSGGRVERLGSTPTEITVDGDRATGVRLGDGTFIAADAVVVGIGVAPDVALAEAGLKLDNGVLVDAFLRTSDPDAYAVGDIANQDHPTLGSRVQNRALGHRA